MFGRPLAEGPVDYVNVHLADERVLACVQCGLYLLSEGDERLVVLVVGATEGGGRQRLRVDVLANTLEAGPRFLKELLAMMHERNVFRQQVISISPGQLGPGPQKLVAFHHLPTVQRDEVILPPALLERIERSTLVFSQHAQQLAAANRSLKRGLLLYGPPGVGKTLTVLYLISHLPGRTTILASGLGLGLLQVIMQLARTLAPATVVLEDVDLIAQERGQSFMGGGNPLLFELLNELDGLREDTDVIVLLTTNRPEILEPALAARPGRIDQVIEFPLPDAADRRRLIDLYAQGLDLAQIDVAALVEQTAGASPAYIKELLRKVAVLAVADTGTLLIQPQHLVTALEEIAQGGLLAQRLLGAQQSPSGPPGMAFSQQMPGFPGAPFHQAR
jgi:GTPase SAR1 family protein